MAKDARPKNASLFTDEELEQQRPLIQLGIQQYNDGYFFEAHETLEDIWYRCQLPFRTYLQALIQLAAAFVHLARHEYPGTIRLLGHSLDKLEGAPDEFFDIDAARLRESVRRARDQIVEFGPDHFEDWDHANIPKIELAKRRRRQARGSK